MAWVYVRKSNGRLMKVWFDDKGHLNKWLNMHPGYQVEKIEGTLKEGYHEPETHRIVRKKVKKYMVSDEAKRKAMMKYIENQRRTLFSEKNIQVLRDFGWSEEKIRQWKAKEEAKLRELEKKVRQGYYDPKIVEHFAKKGLIPAKAVEETVEKEIGKKYHHVSTKSKPHSQVKPKQKSHPQVKSTQQVEKQNTSIPISSSTIKENKKTLIAGALAGIGLAALLLKKV